MVIFSLVCEGHPDTPGTLGALDKNLIVFGGMGLPNDTNSGHFCNSSFIKESALTAGGTSDGTPLGVGLFKLLDQQHRNPSFWQLSHFFRQL